MRVAFVSCVKGKRKGCHRARELYTSPLFRLSFAYARRTCDFVYILSAKHGLLYPERRVRSYDSTLRGMPVGVRRRWARRVALQIRSSIPPDADLYFFCGKRYREFLAGAMGSRGVFVPLEGLGLGKQLQWYRRKLQKGRLR